MENKKKLKIHYSTKQTWNFNEVKWITTFAEFIVICIKQKNTLDIVDIKFLLKTVCHHPFFRSTEK